LTQGERRVKDFFLKNPRTSTSYILNLVYTLKGEKGAASAILTIKAKDPVIAGFLEKILSIAAAEAGMG
jgi:hypothetical protein